MELQRFLPPETSEELQAIRDFMNAAPQILERYELLRLVGRGHFGRVVSAKPKNSNQAAIYAIKLIESDCFKESVQAELVYMATMKGCRNIIEYVEHFDCGPRHTAIVTQYFPGDNFKSTFKNFTPRDVQIYIKNLLIALEQVHSYGILHGDVKPGNFLFNMKNMKFALIDFGMVKPTGAPLRDAGTIGYVAPEAILKYEKSSSVVDIWAAGAMFAILLSGMYPFFHTGGLEAFREYCTLFGHNRTHQTVKSLNKENYVASILRQCENKKALDLKKFCKLFRNYERFYQSVYCVDHCRNCKQWQSLCICKKLCHTNVDLVKVTDDFFPESTYDLLDKMLALNPNERITAKDALKHPFFTEKLNSTAKYIDPLRCRKVGKGLIKVLEAHKA